MKKLEDTEFAKFKRTLAKLKAEQLKKAQKAKAEKDKKKQS